MKTKKIATVLCCSILLATLLTGCFPFNIVQNIMQQNSHTGGADGPTSIIVSTETPAFSETTSDSPTNSTGLDNTYTSGSLNYETWYDCSDENASWSFWDDEAYLYMNETDYFIADYKIYFDDDAVEYIANELSEYGVTKEEQLDLIERRDEYIYYFCLVFTNVRMYENYSFVGNSENQMVPFFGFKVADEDMYYYDMCNMNAGSYGMFCSYNWDYDYSTGTTSTSEATTPGTLPTQEDTQRIGSVENGYVDVPADYVRFSNDVYLGEGTIQYSDITGTNIVTLQYMPNTATNAKSVATGIYNQFKSNSEIDSSSLTTATVTIDGTDAYQVCCYSPAYDLFIVSWSFETDYDDYVHYIAVEFTSDNIDLFNMVEDTYHLLY